MDARTSEKNIYLYRGIKDSFKKKVYQQHLAVLFCRISPHTAKGFSLRLMNALHD